MTDTERPDRMANYYGNTLHVLSKHGSHRVYYHPNGTFDLEFPDHGYAGTYRIEDDWIYLTAVRPGDATATTTRRPFDDSRHAGDSWTISSPDGPVHLQLKAGRP